ncbi:MAG: hypothetical protein Ct9H300mP1_17100 [Planctomycetaceae bacterium]|nr:MAG: hypothetical protein Ct9H300mP1_17100 [Planctomycetaceae bacterium]
MSVTVSDNGRLSVTTAISTSRFPPGLREGRINHSSFSPRGSRQPVHESPCDPRPLLTLDNPVRGRRREKTADRHTHENTFLRQIAAMGCGRAFELVNAGMATFGAENFPGHFPGTSEPTRPRVYSKSRPSLNSPDHTVGIVKARLLVIASRTGRVSRSS